MSTEKQKEQARVRKQRQRDKDKDNSVTSPSVTSKRDMVPALYVMGLNGVMYEALSERPRYLTLSDGQVLDRLKQPVGNRAGDVDMMACNESAYNFKPNMPSKERMKVLEGLKT